MAEEVLRNLGLNAYELKTYLALLGAGKESLQASELSTASGVPMARIYDIMESLERKGFVRIGLGRPTLYQAVPPEEALEAHRARLRIEMERRLEEFDHMRDEAVKELKRHRRARPAAKVKDAFSLLDEEGLRTSLERLALSARKRLLALNLPREGGVKALLSRASAPARSQEQKGVAGFLVADDEMLLWDSEGREGLWTNSRTLVSLAAWAFEARSK
ncbi:MAG: helix-turn-helix domain-containing protein [Halobacteria archaeon]